MKSKPIVNAPKIDERRFVSAILVANLPLFVKPYNEASEENRRST